jgi:hypothetical protein
MSSFVETAGHTLSLKGIVTNGVPLAAMAIIVLIAYLVTPRLRTGTISFERSDVLAALALAVTAFAIGTEFTSGRLVAHSFPALPPDDRGPG